MCFLGSEKFKDYIAKFIPEKQGNIVDIETGKVVGKHQGLSKYTLGQRKGLGIGGGAGKTLEAWFVAKKNLKTNTLFVQQGSGDALFSDCIVVSDFNWIIEKPQNGYECLAKFRYRQDFQKVKVNFANDDVELVCESKQRSVTPGQFAVLYNNENGKIRCLGGGKIKAVKRDGVKLDI